MRFTKNILYFKKGTIGINHKIRANYNGSASKIKLPN